ncbi:MAG: septum formation initiator family protein [Candidatus Competibacterales bacterium]
MSVWLYGAVTLGLLALVALLGQQLFLDPQGPVIQRRAIEARMETQGEENRRLQARNDRLRREIQSLKAGRGEVLEERARSDLGLIGQGETFYRLLPEPPGVVQPVATDRNP